MIILGTDKIIYYLPALLVSGVVSGVVIGVLAALMIARLPKKLTE